MSAPRYTLRRAEPRDTEWLYALHTLTLRPSWEAAGEAWDPLQQRQFFDAGQRDQSPQIIVSSAGHDIGCLKIARRRSELFLKVLTLLPACQRQGFGTAVMNDLLAEAARAGRPVRLQVLRDNPAQRFYERLGFRAVGTTPTHVLMDWNAAPPS